jgi:Na+/melibiose symporter-like transporter
MAGGLINSSRQIGGSIGLAALVTLSASVIAGDGGTDGAEADRVRALAHGYAVAVETAGALLVVAAVIALVLVPARVTAVAVPSSEVREAEEASGRPESQ